MIWTNLKLEALLCSVFYAITLGIGMEIVHNSGLEELPLLHVVDVREDEEVEEEEGGEEETRISIPTIIELCLNL